jgi:ABC-type nitrate/sulfonate/bicarbonate transport system substrate-binding protein
MLRKGVLTLGFTSCFLSFAVLCLAQEMTKLRVSVPTKTLGYGPYWVAAKLGFFSRQGLDVDLVVIRGADVNVQALAGGSIDIAGGSLDAPIAAVERGLDLVIIGGVINGLTQSIMGGKNFKSYEALRGATVGTISLTSGVGLALRWVLKAKGLEYPRDYKLLVIGGSPQTFTALTTGQIAAAALSLPLNYAAEELGFNEIGKFIDVIPNYQLAGPSMRRSWAEKNRPLMIRFMKAMALTMRWLHQNTEAAVDFMAKEMKLKREHARRGWEFYTENRIWHPESDVNAEGLKTTIQIFWEASQPKTPLPSLSKYLDQSYLKEALRELGGKS